MPPSSPQSWVMAGSSTSPACCSAIPRPSAGDWRNWKRQPIWTRVVSEKKGWTQKTNRDICRPRSELLQSARGPHRWRSDAGRGEVDELVSGADFASARRIGDSGQSTGRFPIATQERVPQAESPEEEDDGSPQSKPQRPVQEDHSPQEAVFEGWPARHQHGYEEEGIAWQFLSRRQDRHPGNHRNQRPRLQ